MTVSLWVITASDQKKIQRSNEEKLRRGDKNTPFHKARKYQKTGKDLQVVKILVCYEIVH